MGSALLTLGLFSINKLTWTWSVSAEVFGLNNLFIALLMFIAVMFESSDDPRLCVKVGEAAPCSQALNVLISYPDTDIYRNIYLGRIEMIKLDHCEQGGKTVAWYTNKWSVAHNFLSTPYKMRRQI